MTSFPVEEGRLLSPLGEKFLTLSRDERNEAATSRKPNEARMPYTEKQSSEGKKKLPDLLPSLKTAADLEKVTVVSAARKNKKDARGVCLFDAQAEKIINQLDKPSGVHVKSFDVPCKNLEKQNEDRANGDEKPKRKSQRESDRDLKKLKIECGLAREVVTYMKVHGEHCSLKEKKSEMTGKSQSKDGNRVQGSRDSGSIDIKTHNKTCGKKRELRDKDCLVTLQGNGHHLGDIDGNAFVKRRVRADSETRLGKRSLIQARVKRNQDREVPLTRLLYQKPGILA